MAFQAKWPPGHVPGVEPSCAQGRGGLASHVVRVLAALKASGGRIGRYPARANRSGPDRLATPGGRSGPWRHDVTPLCCCRRPHRSRSRALAHGRIRKKCGRGARVQVAALQDHRARPAARTGRPVGGHRIDQSEHSRSTGSSRRGLIRANLLRFTAPIWPLTQSRLGPSAPSAHDDSPWGMGNSA
jgi:hypothetical protein